MLTIITITKDDFNGVHSTVLSTRDLRNDSKVKQIIVDSSCTAIARCVEELANEEKIDYIWQEPHGISKALNLGITHTEGDWIWFLNGGDVVHPDVESHMILYLLSKSTADAVIFEIEWAELRSIYKHPPLWRIWPCLFEWIPHPGTVFRRTIFERYGLYSEQFKIAMDGESWLRLFSNDAIVDMISIPIAVYDQTGISSTNPALMGSEVKRVIEKYLLLMIKRWVLSGKSIYNAWKRFYLLSKTGQK